MARKIDWGLVRAEHIVTACERLGADAELRRERQSGLYLLFREDRLPAKQVLRLAYCLAAGLPQETKLKFASGDSTLNLLRKLGFAAERLKKTEQA